VSDPDGDLVSVWYDWGDGTPMTAGDPVADYTSSHTYVEQGAYTLSAYAEDGEGNNASDSASVSVSDGNLRPTVISFGVVDSQDYYAPGETLLLAATVDDAEGDLVHVTIDFGDGSIVETLSRDLDPDVPSEFEFSHAYAVGSDTRYTATLEVTDDAFHTVEWFTASLQVLVNTVPDCVVVADPMVGSLSTTFTFDASTSTDAETAADDLVVRWDWNGDGAWDTDWSSEKTATHVFSSVGTHTVVCEAEDGAGLSSVDQVDVEVVDGAIPEFPLVLMPVIMVLALFLVMRARKR